MLLAAGRLLVDSAPAAACSLAGNEPHYVDAAFSTDATPPGAVTATATVERHYEKDDGGCGTSKVASCGSYGLVTLTATATDDIAPADRIGYEITVTDGTPPPDFNVPAMPVRAFGYDGNVIYLYYSVTRHTGFRVTLEIRAVDLNGNLGPPTQLVVEESDADAAEPDGGGCSTVPAPPAVGLAFGALLLVLRRRGRR